MRLQLLRVAVASLTGVAPVAAAEDGPAAVATEFCRLHGAGNEAAEKATMTLLTPSLIAAIEEAQRKSDAIEAAHPDEKPPLGDGVPFQSYPDVADSCKADASTATTVDVTYGFTDVASAGWTDRLVLEPVEGKLLIDDIRYGVDDHKQTLRGALLEMFK